MRQITCLILLILISLPAYAKDSPEIKKKINPEVQLQENGWIKIVDQYIQKQSAEEFYGQYMSERNRGQVIRKLHVKIQFLKPCTATSKWSDYLEKYSPPGNDPDAVIPLIGKEGECIKLAMSNMDAYKQGKQMSSWLDKCPDMMEYITSRFKCDYRNKVFVTYYSSSGDEIKTESEYSIASYESDPWYGEKIKTEMLPGEKHRITFFVPDNADSWYVWVSK